MNTPLINVEALKIYRDYTYERSKVYYKKEILKESGPWTDDPFISKYKFTNIRRELDKQSVFLIDTVINNPDLSLDDIALNCALFRTLNHHDAVKYLKEWPVRFERFDIPRFKFYEDNLDKTGLTMQSNAYFLSQIRKAAYERCEELRGRNSCLVEFIRQYALPIIDAFWADSPHKSVELLRKVPGFGDFMAYQIWVDFTYSERYLFTEDDYVISGPGCSDGINWMSPNLNGLDYNQFIVWFRDSLPRLMAENNLEWNPSEFQHYLPENQRDWNLMNIENSFCEFNKLMKLKSNVKMRVRHYNV